MKKLFCLFAMTFMFALMANSQPSSYYQIGYATGQGDAMNLLEAATYEQICYGVDFGGGNNNGGGEIGDPGSAIIGPGLGSFSCRAFYPGMEIGFWDFKYQYIQNAINAIHSDPLNTANRDFYNGLMHGFELKLAEYGF